MKTKTEKLKEELTNREIIYYTILNKVLKKYSKMAIKQGRKERNEEVLKIIEDVDIELLFTDIKDKEGKKVSFSDDLIEIIKGALLIAILKEQIKSKLKEK